MSSTHLDLFSGIGGFTLAAQLAGFKTIGFSEIDPYASAVLKKHWPEIINYGDIRAIPDGRCDLITGGFPCQPFSNTGKRRGAEDDRFLWPSMLNVIERWNPLAVLGENVNGIIDLELDNCISDLENISYQAQPITIPACAFNAPIERDRVWIIALSNKIHGQPRMGNCKEETICPWPRASSEDVWIQAAREIIGVDDGVRGRLYIDRVAAIGNSIVPQIAEIILKEIYQVICQTSKC